MTDDSMRQPAEVYAAGVQRWLDQGTARFKCPVRRRVVTLTVEDKKRTVRHILAAGGYPSHAVAAVERLVA